MGYDDATIELFEEAMEAALADKQRVKQKPQG